DGVGVLELVDQDMAEAALVMAADLGVVADQLQGAQQQLVEVHQPATAAQLLVGVVDLLHGGEEQVAMRLDMLGATALVLLAVDEPLGLASRPAAVIQAKVANDALDQAQLVVGIEDLEALDRKSTCLNFSHV